jgi:hypothetical protein
MEPILIWSPAHPTARSASQLSSVSPLRALTVTAHPAVAGQPQRLGRLGQRADLVHLQQQGRAAAAGDGHLDPPGVRAEEVVAEHQGRRADRLLQRRPVAPVLLGQRVLDADDRVLRTHPFTTSTMVRLSSGSGPPVLGLVTPRW